MLYLLDYGAGNVRSLANSIRKLGHDFKWVTSPSDLQSDNVTALLFPGVGAFGPAIESLSKSGYLTALHDYIRSGKPYMGICIGMQVLFQSSDEAPGVQGLGIVPGKVQRFDESDRYKSVPHMGWNRANPVVDASFASQFGLSDEQARPQHFYFVHSFRAAVVPDQHERWALTTTQYGTEIFLSSIANENVFATQFHPEKSGRAGLEVLKAWLDRAGGSNTSSSPPQRGVLPKPLSQAIQPAQKDGLTKRVVACLDVRSNDQGDLVVTKGESYDVREQSTSAVAGGRAVRNLGKPVALSERYYQEGADEVCFLNITSFRSAALRDQPMLAVVEAAAACVFVPLTVGGGIKDTVDPDGTKRSAKEVADAYFRAGADKVSIGSEAVHAVLDLISASQTLGSAEHEARDPGTAPAEALKGTTGIENISKAYGAQAVVVSIDPKRVYISEQEKHGHAHQRSIVSGLSGTADDRKCWWYQCTVSGGREAKDLDVVQLARGVARLGAGELLINSIDMDGQGNGFDRQLIDLVRSSVNVPVVASSGAGSAKHFQDVFEPKVLRSKDSEPATPIPSSVEAALAAGIFHRKEVSIQEVKQHLAKNGFEVRIEDTQEGAGALVSQATEDTGHVAIA
ncbi:imidazoleglycerol phosphate synthase [Ceraceosorus bombacis]|uniref:Imidazoleglycerol phosphate synthase n=1 Tax=Ceraceosorus bombacis TaxID=401625 RepID=A0A0P1BD96_9BASI|nr:imidazoleglycerol phosphate synthase [Ceraceosorus bombacis]